jgi:hypothetical protein
MINEPLKSKNIKVMLFEADNLLDIQTKINDWLANTKLYIHDIQFSQCKTPTHKDLIGPVVENALFAAIVYSETPRARIIG